LFWNARNDYKQPFLAMAEMRAAPGRFFRGDEVEKRRAEGTGPAPAEAATSAAAAPRAGLQ